MPTQRFKEIDLLRGIAIILVLLGHSIIVYPIDLHEVLWCNVLFTWLSTVHMPLFFLISGFCYSLGTEGYGKYLLKKTKRLFVPYVFFCIFDMSVRVVFESLVNQQRGLFDSVKDMIFFGGGYWFLYVLYILFIIFPFLERVIKKHMGTVWVLLVSLVVLEMFSILPGIFMLDSVGRYMIYFLIGYLLKIWRVKITSMLSYAKDVESELSVAIILLWMVSVGITVAVGSNPILNLMAAMLGIGSLWIFVKKIRCRRNYWLIEFSRYSLPLYLMNGYLLVISRTILVSKMGITNPLVIIIGNMFVTLFLAWALIKFVIDKVKCFKFVFGMQ